MKTSVFSYDPNVFEFQKANGCIRCFYGAIDFDAELVAFQYECRGNYLRNMSEEELFKRHKQILMNQKFLFREENLALFDVNSQEQKANFENPWYWIIKEYETLLEVFKRGLKSSISYEPIRQDVLIHKLLPGKIVKYGRFQHLKEALESGIILLRKNYTDPNLSSAQYDEEYVKHNFRRAETHIMKSMRTGNEHRPLEGSYVKYSKESKKNDVYMYCCTASSMSRNLACSISHEYDAALIINEPRIFCTKIAEALRKKFGAFLPMDMRKITYYDPYSESPLEHPLVVKTFDYAWQQEFRFIFIPWWEDSLYEMKLELGPLNEIATLEKF